MEVTILYFLAEQEFPQKVVFRILEVWTDYTIRNASPPRRRPSIVRAGGPAAARRPARQKPIDGARGVV